MNFNDDFLQEINKALEKDTTTYIDIRNVQRNGRKSITTIEGLSNEMDLKQLLSTWKKQFSCNGSIQKMENNQLVIQLSGNKSAEIKQYLVEHRICDSKWIRIH